jgi:hypothetical protein
VSSIQFAIPRQAADAVDFVAVRQHGRAARLPRTSIEISTISAPIGKARVTFPIDMAIFSVEALRTIAEAASEKGKSSSRSHAPREPRPRTRRSTWNAHGRRTNHRRATESLRELRRRIAV